MSVSANIVEGSAHESRREFARFIRYAIASASEFEGHLQTAFDIDALSQQDATALQSQIIEVRKMLYGLLKSIKPDR